MGFAKSWSLELCGLALLEAFTKGTDAPQFGGKSLSSP